MALLLGPTGVGLVGLFQSSIALVAQLTGLGIGSSGVRQIAYAFGTGDNVEAGKTVRVLRRTCWATGILGWVVTVILARPLSIWAFESAENAWLISIVGVTLLLTAVSHGQAAISVYAVMGVAGIVPVMVLTAVIRLGCSWWFAKRIAIPPSGHLTWQETYRTGKQLTHLGFAFMWSGLLAALVDVGVRGLIVRDAGEVGAGIYQAVWALSPLTPW